MSDNEAFAKLVELKYEFHKVERDLPTLDAEKWRTAHNRMGELAVLIDNHTAAHAASPQARLDLGSRASKAARELLGPGGG